MKTSSSKNPSNQSVASLVTRVLDKRWRRFRQALKRCRNQSSETSVHELRVSIRRLLSTLEVLRHIVPEGTLKKGRRSLRKMLSLLSPPRDAQICVQYLTELLPTYPELERPHRIATKQEEKLIRKAGIELGEIETNSLEKLIDRSRKTLAARSVRSGRDLSTLHHAIDTAFETVLKRRREIDRSIPVTIHRTRVAFKKFRYLIEMLQPVLEGVPVKQLRQMNNLQAQMGKIQDLEVVSAYLDDFAKEKKPPVSRSLLRIRQELVEQRARAVASFLGAAPQIDRLWTAPEKRLRT